MLNAAHWPELHQRDVDEDLSHGRMLCMACHIIEEWNRGNHRGARLLYRKFTFRTRNWVSQHEGQDEKPELDLLILEEVYSAK